MSAILVTAFLLPTISSAQGNEVTIAALMEQIKQLQAQITALQTAQQEVREEIAPVIEFARTLRQGAQGDDVRMIQALLASDPSVYPEGVISGQYGRMTTNAVKRFQRKHGLAPVGTVDTRTYLEMDEMYDDEKMELQVIQSTTGTETVVCHRIPPGHFVAPGWQRRHGGNREIVPDCQTLPPGIAKKLHFPGTSTPSTDVDAPTVSVTSPFSGARISRNVMLRATAQDNVRVAGVQFVVDDYFVGGEDMAAPYTTSWNSRGVANGMHTVVAVARDRAGNRATSSPVSIFVNNGRNGNGNTNGNGNNNGNGNGTTTPQPDTTAPQIINVISSGIGSTTATISWTTNEAATTRVYYSTVSPVATATAQFQEVGGSRTAHSVNLTSLAGGTTYFLLIVATDAVGNRTSMPTTITTTSQSGSGDTTAPVITNIVSSGIGSTTATISWTTNEAATTRVYYSTHTPVTTFKPFQEVTGSRTSHSITLTQLDPGMTYNILVVSTDAAGNMTSMTMPTTITTTSQPVGDTSAPLISNVVSTVVVSTTANISWTTNEAATTRVYYSTVSPVATATAQFQEVGGSRTAHSVNLTPLAGGTTYFLLIVATDAAGNRTSMPTTLTTPPLADMTAPNISNIVSGGVASTTANISWTTNEATIGNVYYGTTNPLLFSGSSVTPVSVFANSHNAHLHSLSPNTTYFYVVVASDTANNNATSTHHSFVTMN